MKTETDNKATGARAPLRKKTQNGCSVELVLTLRTDRTIKKSDSSKGNREKGADKAGTRSMGRGSGVITGAGNAGNNEKE